MSRLTQNELDGILESHKVYLTTLGSEGAKANLANYDLSGLNLRSANLSSADLRFANLRSANLSSANLRYADLCSADLYSANLRFADLRSADLRFANLRSANLSSADLRSANLSSANLRSADLCSANLSFANLPDKTFIIMGETYPIIICNGGYVQAGCQNHTVEDWFNKSKEDVMDMDGMTAIKYYPRLLDVIDFYLPSDVPRVRPNWVTTE